MQARSPRFLLAALVLLLALPGCGQTLAASANAGAHDTFVAGNCAPVAASSSGTMLWYRRNSAGVWDAYIGNGSCHGKPLLPPYDGNRGPAGITANGRYVLLTTAVGLDRTLSYSSPGQGSGNEIQLYDRRTHRLSTLLAGASASQRGVIWPTFNANATKIVWSQMLEAAFEDPPVGRWALHVADVNLAAGTLSDNVEWQEPGGRPNFYEAYGWVPNTKLLIFMSGTRSQSSGPARRAAVHAPGKPAAAERADTDQPAVRARLAVAIGGQRLPRVCALRAQPPANAVHVGGRRHGRRR